MTLVRMFFSRPEASGVLTPATGSLSWTPTRRRVIDGTPDNVILPRAFSVPLVAGKADVTVAPTGTDWVWRVDEYISGGAYTTIYVSVPNVAEVDYASLIQVDIDTLNPTATPSPAWVAMANSTVTTGTVTGDSLILTRTDGTTVNAGNVRGAQGLAGPANTLAIGTVTTGAAGTAAAATITGAAPAQTLSLTIPKGDPGTGGGGESAYELRGTGMPNGVVTASPGTYYTDTAGTNGAWRWIKTSGTGNTGWVVIKGDTGWRALTDIVTGSSSTKLFLRREGSTTSLIIDHPASTTGSGEGANNGKVFTVPDGFGSRPATSTYFLFVKPYGFSTTGSLEVYGTSLGFYWVANERAQGVATWITSEAWPTTLPGTAA